MGISAFYHDSAACIVRDGEISAAAQEERFTRRKSTGEFPRQAINFCVQQAGISFAEIDHVAFFEKPYLKFARVMIEHIEAFPFSFPSFFRSMPEWLDTRLSLPLIIQEETGVEARPYFIRHHLSHAASAFLPSPFEEAAILTADGVGEWATLSTGAGRGKEITIGKEIHYPDSLGLLYTCFTVFLGFEANGGEGKTMALAGFGDPKRFAAEMRELVQVMDDGSFRLNGKFFSFRSGNQMWSRRFEEAFGAPRIPGSSLEQRHYDMAAALQSTVTEILVGIARRLREETGMKKLCLAGGVALNCVANAAILEQAGFDEMFVQPAAGDAGGALGAALYVAHCLKGVPRPGAPMRDAYLGPAFAERDILRALQVKGISGYRKLSPEDLCRETAAILADDKVVGWFQGRMEFGPRALGARSILGNPRNARMGDEINAKVKQREPFRPFAPMVLAERAKEYFHLGTESPFMLLAPRVRDEKRGEVPAAVHVDGTARVQTVAPDGHERVRLLLREFEKATGTPVLLNTSFNRRGEPVVCSPEQALDCYLGTGMDALAIGDFLLEKLPRRDLAVK